MVLPMFQYCTVCCGRPLSAFLTTLLFGLTACGARQPAVTHPDKVLFEHAMTAVEGNRFDVAHITLQTLVNTYPHSKYTAKAELLLKDDPRIAECPEWSAPPCQ